MWTLPAKNPSLELVWVLWAEMKLKGQIIAANFRSFEVYHDPLTAETFAFLEGIRMAERLNIRAVQLESDSLQLIKSLTEDEVDNGKMSVV